MFFFFQVLRSNISDGNYMFIHLFSLYVLCFV